MHFFAYNFIQICTFVKTHLLMVKEKLRKLRIDKGISQKEIATCLPTDVSNYNRKELGEVKITKQEWEKISAFLAVPIEEIYEADSEKKTSLKYKNPIFNDNSISVQYVEIMPSLVENLQQFITMLQEENAQLRKELSGLKNRWSEEDHSSF